MAPINIGIVSDRHKEQLDELKNILRELTGEQPEKELITALAGPNDVVQLIIDPDNLGYLRAFAETYGNGFIEGLGALTAAAVWGKKKSWFELLNATSRSVFIRLAKVIETLLDKEEMFTIAIKICNTPRNAGITITTTDPVEIAWLLSNVVRSSKEICDIIERARPSEQLSVLTNINKDFSIKISVEPNGRVSVLGVPVDPQVDRKVGNG